MSLEAVKKYLNHESGKRLYFVEGKLDYRHYTKIPPIERFLALFGCGNASYKNVIEIAKQYEREVYEGYTKLFASCKDLGLNQVQLMGLSTSLFAKIPEPEKSDWIERSNHALFRAMTEAVQARKIEHVVLVDFQTKPWFDRIKEQFLF